MSELVAAVSLSFKAGDDLLLRLVVTKNDMPVNLTGMDIVFTAARPGGFDPVISTEPTTPTATVIDGDTGNDIDIAEGSYGIAVDSAVTADLYGTYEFSSKVIDGSGDVSTVARGYLTFS